MVSLGNICRSPLAEGILQAKGKHLKLKIYSAGKSACHIGKQPDRRSIKIAKEHNIDLNNQRARQFSRSDFDEFDIIYAMDINNYAHLISLASSEKERIKIRMILNEINPNSYQSVQDPYYLGENGFQDTYNILEQSCDKIIQNIE